MRYLLCLFALLLQPSLASASIVGPDRHYYGPLLLLQGVGYKESVEKDGAWRIVTNSRRVDGAGFSLAMALYRAAELARDAGFSHVQILGGYSARETGIGVNSGSEMAKVFARGSNSQNAPDGCRSQKSGECYTVPVAEILAVAGAAIGRGGVARPILYPLPTRVAPVVQPHRDASNPLARTPEQVLADRLKAAQPVRGGEPTQGWTVSD